MGKIHCEVWGMEELGGVGLIQGGWKAVYTITSISLTQLTLIAHLIDISSICKTTIKHFILHFLHTHKHKHKHFSNNLFSMSTTTTTKKLFEYYEYWNIIEISSEHSSRINSTTKNLPFYEKDIFSVPISVPISNFKNKLSRKKK